METVEMEDLDIRGEYVVFECHAPKWWTLNFYFSNGEPRACWLSIDDYKEKMRDKPHVMAAKKDWRGKMKTLVEPRHVLEWYQNQIKEET